MRTAARFSSIGVLCLWAALAVPVGAQVTQRVSLSSAGLQGNGSCTRQPDLSADARWIVFESTSSDLVPGDTNAESDIFLRDRTSGTTQRVSVDAVGLEGDGLSQGPCITPDGRWVAFQSAASNLVPLDTNGVQDVFVKDLQTGAVDLVSVDSSGVPGDDDSFFPGLSSDARFVVFMSHATTLVPGDTNGMRDIFVHDRQTGMTERASVSTSGTQGDGDCPFYSSISRDGSYVLFYTDSTNLVAGDTNGVFDVFLRDLQTDTTERISIATGGTEGDSSSSLAVITDDARYVTFMSDASNLVVGDTNGWVDCFVRDRVLATTERISITSGGVQGDGLSEYPMPSADGRFIVFTSNASTLAPGDTNGAKDVYLKDRTTGTLERISVDSTGVQGNALCHYYPTITPDGRYIAFASTASNHVQADTNTGFDVFLRDRNPPAYVALCNPGMGGVVNCPCGNPPSGLGRGCNNSSSTGGAILSSAGGAYLSSDSVVFYTSAEKPTALSIVLQGTSSIAGGAVYGQGVRCVGGSLKRLYSKSASGGAITAPNFGAGDLMVHSRSAQLGDPLLPGGMRWYMVFYRDPNVLGGCPATSTFNSTPTIGMTWAP